MPTVPSPCRLLPRVCSPGGGQQRLRSQYSLCSCQASAFGGKAGATCPSRIFLTCSLLILTPEMAPREQYSMPAEGAVFSRELPSLATLVSCAAPIKKVTVSCLIGNHVRRERCDCRQELENTGRLVSLNTSTHLAAL